MKASFIYFIIPDPSSFPSGGNIYNAGLTEALKVAWPNFQQYTYEEWSKERLGWDDLDSFLFFDTLYLNEMEAWKESDAPKAQLFLIVHHLKSLEQEGALRQIQFHESELPILKRMDGVLTSSPFTLDYLREMQYQYKKGIAILPALELSVTEFIPKFKTINAILVANLIERKGVLEYLTQVEAHKIKLEGVSITIIGNDVLDFAYAKFCKEKIATLATSSKSCTIKYLGALPHAKTLALMRQSNLFISCASMETYGMALQEARAIGLPILAVRGGNVAEHIDVGENGFLYEGVAELVKGFCQLNLDKSLFEKLSLQAKAKSQSKIYSWSDAAKQLLNQLLDLVD